jgi:3-hydroxyisobutyrate dehydrogenase
VEGIDIYHALRSGSLSVCSSGTSEARDRSRHDHALGRRWATWLQYSALIRLDAKHERQQSCCYRGSHDADSSNQKVLENGNEAMNKSNYTGTVGYVGLGDMGGGVATHLVEVGIDVHVFDLNDDAIARLVDKGAVGASSLQDLVNSSDVIIVCVDPERAVVAVTQELAELVRAGQTVIIQSSVPPTWVAEIAEAMQQKDVKLFDAAVSGSHADRQNGTLAVLVGATEEGVGRERDLLESIGRPLYMGKVGGGEVAKLANNAVMNVTRLAMAETMEFGRAFGLAEEDILRAISISSGASFVQQNWGYFDTQIKTGMVMRLAAPQAQAIADLAERKGLHLYMQEVAIKHGPTIDEMRSAYLSTQNEESR